MNISFEYELGTFLIFEIARTVQKLWNSTVYNQLAILNTFFLYD